MYMIMYIVMILV